MTCKGYQLTGCDGHPPRRRDQPARTEDDHSVLLSREEWKDLHAVSVLSDTGRDRRDRHDWRTVKKCLCQRPQTTARR